MMMRYFFVLVLFLGFFHVFSTITVVRAEEKIKTIFCFTPEYNENTEQRN